MDRKREMIRELTNSAWSILAQYEKEEKAGTLSRSEAQKAAILNIKYLRYGEESKDYFWITDMHPNMVMHPYRPDLNGTSLTEFSDPHGKKLFVEFVKVVENNEQGYMDYMWQWKDDASRIVPKLSFVRGFKPWGWIIGTGIYTEDVKAEIARMEGRLIKISLFIILLVAILLIFILRQSVRIENQRKKAEQDLSDSRERYKALVEASTEGSLMFVDGHTYANGRLLGMLGFSESEIANHTFDEIIPETGFSDKALTFSDLVSLFYNPRQFESRLRHKDGRLINALLSVSNISLAGSDAIIVLTKELKPADTGEGFMSGTHSRAGQTADRSGIGVFRTTLARKSMFVEANNAAILILTKKKGSDLFGTNIEDFFTDVDERRALVKELITEGSAQRLFLRIVRTDKTYCYVRVALSLVTEPGSDAKYCDGIVEDVTAQRELGMASDKNTAAMQASSLWMSLPVEDWCETEPVVCSMNVSVLKAAQMLTENNVGALLVESDGGEVAGLITDAELRKFVSMHQADSNTAVCRIMHSPVWEVPGNMPLFEAFQLLRKNRLTHLLVIPRTGLKRKLFDGNVLIRSIEMTAATIRHDIDNAVGVTELIQAHRRAQQSIIHSLGIGLNPKQLTHIIAETSEAIICRLNDLAIAELGPPPVPYAFITLGSVGRSEQTLATDQDNAIVFADTPKESEAEVREYFSKFGSRICAQLDAIGYEFCKGQIMAQNVKYCQPLATWKKYFTDWVNTVEPQDLLDVNIFFDFRFSYGDKTLSDELKKHLRIMTDNNNVFFYHLAVNTLSLKPPIGFFGNIIKDSKEHQPDTFDIKKAIMPIIGFARIYSLKNNVDECNTLERLTALYEIGMLSKQELIQLRQMYNYLMNLRFRHQAGQLTDLQKPDNYIKPGMLTDLDNAILKKIFAMTNLVQTKLNFDFKGSAS
jgi:PAS domain S-box-containing protein